MRPEDFDRRLSELPSDLQPKAELVAAPQAWDMLSPEERRLRAQEFDSEAADMERMRASLRWRPTPEEDAAEYIVWCDATLAAAHWFSLKDVEPEQAAMLLCQFNPNKVTLELAKQCTNDVTGPQDFLRLVQRFEDLGKCEPQHRSLLQWLHFAMASKLRHHPWIDEYVKAAGLVVGEPCAAEPVPVEPTAGLEHEVVAGQSKDASDEAQFAGHFDIAARRLKLQAEHAGLSAKEPQTVTEHKTKREELSHIEGALRALDEEEEAGNVEAPASAKPVPGADDASHIEPVARWRAQELTILNKLRELHYSPGALPRHEAWKPGVKSEVRAAIGSQGMWHSQKVFDKAWERLRERGEIADKP